jgi:hypothetical protein
MSSNVPLHKVPVPEPKGLRVKVTFTERLIAPVGLGMLTHVDGWLRPDGLVRVDYHPERQHPAEFEYVLVPVSYVTAMAVYRDQRG